jgi:hypothetical protein
VRATAASHSYWDAHLFTATESGAIVTAISKGRCAIVGILVICTGSSCPRATEGFAAAMRLF